MTLRWHTQLVPYQRYSTTSPANPWPTAKLASLPLAALYYSDQGRWGADPVARAVSSL